MAVVKVTESIVKAAVYGGGVLGGGGGGWIDEGLALGKLALAAGTPNIITLDELSDDDIVVTVALVGAPAAKNDFFKPEYYVRALELLSEKLGKKISGIITNENGPGTTVNGWYQAAVTGIPIVDAPCNGRAHPTGSMGSMNLHENKEYVSVQAAVGGDEHHYLELCTAGSLDKVSSLIRAASVQAGGLVAVARNPVEVSYVKKHGAPGAINQAIKVGEVLLANQGMQAVDAVTKELGGEVICAGEVSDYTLETKNGFDIGAVMIKGEYELTFWNEYMTLEKNGERLSSFPDLIMTLDVETGSPVISASIQKGQHVAVISVPKENLFLSSTMKNHNLLKAIEENINKPILHYMK